MCISHQKRPQIPTLPVMPLPKDPVEPSKKRRHAHIIVQHNYHDHGVDPIVSEESICHRNTTVPSFPHKLYEFLENADAEGISHIVSWQPHGRCFVVHQPELFKELLPRFFAVSKVASFQRQLNLYGFLRLTRGADKSGYYNERFLRSRPDLLHTIQRVKVKGTGVRARSNPETEPDFYRMKPMPTSNELSQLPNLVRSTSVISDTSSLESSLPMKTESRAPEDLVVCGWGLPFHYIPDELPQLLSVQQVSNMDNYDDLFSDIDLDVIVEDLCHDDDLLAQMLERAVA